MGLYHFLMLEKKAKKMIWIKGFFKILVIVCWFVLMLGIIGLYEYTIATFILLLYLGCYFCYWELVKLENGRKFREEQNKNMVRQLEEESEDD